MRNTVAINPFFDFPRWCDQEGQDALSLMLGRIELGALYRSVRGVYAVSFDGKELGEFKTIEEGQQAIEADIMGEETGSVNRLQSKEQENSKHEAPVDEATQDRSSAPQKEGEKEA